VKKLLLILLVLGCTSAGAHGLRYTVTRGESVVITLTYSNGGAFADETYEIFRAGGNELYQRGRTDPFGRIVFMPDSSGAWRIRAFSEDGHGLDISIETTSPSEHPDTSKSPADTLEKKDAGDGKAPVGTGWRIVMAFSLIFGMFGVVSIFLRKKK
jgi:nickel transport protein